MSWDVGISHICICIDVNKREKNSDRRISVCLFPKAYIKRMSILLGDLLTDFI